MRPFSTFGHNAPYATALTVVGLFAAFFIVPVLWHGAFDMTAGTGLIAMTDLRPFIATETLAVLALLVVVAALRWWTQTGLIVRADPAGLRLFGWIVILPVLVLSTVWIALATQTDLESLRPGPVEIAILALLIGVFEEGLFRGVLLHGLRSRHGPGRAVVLSALLFGLFHLVNAVFGQNLFLTLLQIATATALGLFLAVITLQTRTLWPAILLHALWDGYALSVPLLFTAFPAQTTGPAPEPGLVSLIIPGLLSLAALVIYRRWCRRITVTASR